MLIMAILNIYTDWYLWLLTFLPVMGSTTLLFQTFQTLINLLITTINWVDFFFPLATLYHAVRLLIGLWAFFGIYRIIRSMLPF